MISFGPHLEGAFITHRSFKWIEGPHIRLSSAKSFILSLHFDIGNPRLDIDSLQSKRTSGKSVIGTGRYPLMDILVSVSVSVIYSCRQYFVSKIARVE
jgi:hypothetical protein